MLAPSVSSGGQKQRVSMARAVYHKSDIVLMDDPLSAVDQNVGKHIFDQCIRGFLSDRTVIIVTHQLQYLHRCDKIVMLQNGKIAYQGTYDELMANEPTFNTLINTHVSNEDDEAPPEDGAILPEDDDVDNDADVEEGSHLTLAEQMAANESDNQVTATKSPSLTKIKRARMGAGHRRHTLPPGTKVGDIPGTATIVNQNYATITPQERLRLLQRQLPYINRDSILANTLQEHTNLNFINRLGREYGAPINNGFSRAVYRNELTIYSIPEGAIYGSKNKNKKRSRTMKTKHRNSVTGASTRKSSMRSESGSFDYTDDEGHLRHHSTTTGGNDVEVRYDSEDMTSDEDGDEDEEGSGRLIGDDKSMDELGFADYVKYFRSGSGVVTTILLIILFFIAHGIRIGSDYWLRLWVPNTLHATDSLYLGVYGAFITLFTFAVLIRGLWFAHEATLKSKELHDRAFKVRLNKTSRRSLILLFFSSLVLTLILYP